MNMFYVNRYVVYFLKKLMIYIIVEYIKKNDCKFEM